jgi:hypothetical protein
MDCSFAERRKRSPFNTCRQPSIAPHLSSAGPLARRAKKWFTRALRSPFILRFVAGRREWSRAGINKSAPVARCAIFVFDSAADACRVPRAGGCPRGKRRRDHLLGRKQRIASIRIIREFLGIRRAIARFPHKRPEYAFAARGRSDCDGARGRNRYRLRSGGRRHAIGRCRRSISASRRRRHAIGRRRRSISASRGRLWRGIGRRGWRIAAIRAIRSIPGRSIVIVTVRPIGSVTVIPAPIIIWRTCHQRRRGEN